MKLNDALKQVIKSIKDYVNKIMPKKLSDLEIDMELGTVKTVNGIEPDEAGNITVEVEGGFSGEYNDLKGKTHYDTFKSTEIFNDEVSFEDPNAGFVGSYFVDDYLSESLHNNVGCKTKVCIGNDIYICNVNQVSTKYDGVSAFYVGNGNHVKLLAGSMITDDLDNTGEPFAILDMQGAILFAYESSEEITTNVVITLDSGELKQLDEKFVPDSISRADHVHSYNDLIDKTHYDNTEYVESFNETFTAVYDGGDEVGDITYYSSNNYTKVNANQKIRCTIDGHEYILEPCQIYAIFGENHLPFLTPIFGNVDKYFEMTKTIASAYNPYIVGSGDNTCNFCIITSDGDMPVNICFFDEKKDTEHSVKIELIEGGLKQLDEKFLPEGLAKTTYVDEQIENHIHSWEEIEDKPFEKVVKYVDIVNGKFTTQEVMKSPMIADNTITIPVFTHGDKVRVTYGDTTYDLEAYLYEEELFADDVILIGNKALYQLAETPLEDTGEPFVINTSSETEGFLVMFVKDHATDVRVVISVEDKVEQVNESSVPDSIARTQYVDENFALKSDLQNIDLSSLETKEDAQVKYDTIVEAKADWNQNDPNAIDYVKNRPFYTTDPQPVELCNGTYEFVNSSVTIDENKPFYETSIDYNGEDLVANKEITVVYDGNTYNFTIGEVFVGYNGATMLFGLYVGNISILSEYITAVAKVPLANEIVDTGEPFVLNFASGVFVPITKDGAPTHDISISINKPVDITIPQKYLGVPVWAGEGRNSIVIGDENGVASGDFAVCEGIENEASGNYSHAEGSSTTASGYASHAEGWRTTASSDYQHVQGKFNIEDTEKKYVHIVGNGANAGATSNAHTLDWNGNAWFAGNIKIGGSSYDEGVELALKSDLDNIDLSGLETKTDAQTKLDQAIAYTDTAVANLVNSAPETLDTLGELATAFEENAEVVDALNEAIVNKADKNDIVQSDWNCNDETSAAYIKNRPFYKTTTNVVLLEETNVVGKSATINVGSSGVMELVYGDMCSVIWDGVQYDDLEVEVRGGYAWFGDYTLSEYPFSIVYNTSTGEATVDMADEESHVFSILKVEESYEQLDRNYIKDIPGKIVIDDNTFNTGEIFNDYYNSTASGNYSHSEGLNTHSNGDYSHAEGRGTIASGEAQHVQGKYNVEDTQNKYAHIVGNGTADSARSNAHTLDWSGNAEFQGDVIAVGCGGEAPVSLLEMSRKLDSLINGNEVAY